MFGGIVRPPNLLHLLLLLLFIFFPFLLFFIFLFPIQSHSPLPLFSLFYLLLLLLLFFSYPSSFFYFLFKAHSPSFPFFSPYFSPFLPHLSFIPIITMTWPPLTSLSTVPLSVTSRCWRQPPYSDHSFISSFLVSFLFFSSLSSFLYLSLSSLVTATPPSSDKTTTHTHCQHHLLSPIFVCVTIGDDIPFLASHHFLSSSFSLYFSLSFSSFPPQYPFPPLSFQKLRKL